MNPHNLEETALSAAGRTQPPDQADRTEAAPAESTDVGGPTDVTVVRGTPSSPTVDDMSSASTCGKYELLGEIARGGMGVVYRARQHGLDRFVALKMILGTGADNETAQRFLQEARAAAALDHPNVVPIYDTGENEGRPYFTMALIDGPNLRGFIEQRGLPSIPLAVALFAQIVAGVAHAHRHGFIHRDLKPANVLIDQDGRPRVTDFGLAKRSQVDSQLTATGQVVGTPQYMAPEQARDSKDVGPPADVYALGAILYFLLTGRPPFTADNLTDLLIKVVSESPAPLRSARADVPSDLEELCLRCLAKKPAERFPDAEALAAALVPITDQYLTPSTNLSPSHGVIGLRGSVPSAPGLPNRNTSAPSAHVGAPSVSVPPEGATQNRKPVLIGLGTLAAVLVAVIVYLATRDKPQEVTKQDPPAGNTGQPNPDVKDAGVRANAFAWPPPARNDFGLKVELAAVGAKKGADGVFSLHSGTELELRVTAAKDCRVSVWVLDDNTELRLFPNDSETDDHLVAGQERVIPGKDGRAFITTPTVGDVDRLRILATTGAGPVFPEGVKKSGYTVYVNAPERQRLASTIRGVVLGPPGGSKSDTGEVSEAELRLRVQK